MKRRVGGKRFQTKGGWIPTESILSSLKRSSVSDFLEKKSPSALVFLNFYVESATASVSGDKGGKNDSSSKRTITSEEEFLGQFLLEVMQLEAQFSGTKPSLKAAVALWLAVYMEARESAELLDFSELFEFSYLLCFTMGSFDFTKEIRVTGYDANAVLEPKAIELFGKLSAYRNECKFVWKKYGTHEFQYITHKYKDMDFSISDVKTYLSSYHKTHEPKPFRHRKLLNTKKLSAALKNLRGCTEGNESDQEGRTVKEYVDKSQFDPVMDEEVYTHRKQSEKKYLPSKNYFAKHPEINARMRTILIDWLVDVQVKFKLVPETLYMTVDIIDRVLSKTSNQKRIKLQLLGISAMWTASKVVEIFPTEALDMVCITDRAYTSEEIINQEFYITNTLQYALTSPCPTDFLKYYARKVGVGVPASGYYYYASKADGSASSKVFFLALFLLESMAVEFEYVGELPSLKATMALYLANLLEEGPTYLESSWSRVLIELSGFDERLLKPKVLQLYLGLNYPDGKVIQKTTRVKLGHWKSSKNEYQVYAIWKKYSKPKYHCVSDTDKGVVLKRPEIEKALSEGAEYMTWFEKCVADSAATAHNVQAKVSRNTSQSESSNDAIITDEKYKEMIRSELTPLSRHEYFTRHKATNDAGEKEDYMNEYGRQAWVAYFCAIHFFYKFKSETFRLALDIFDRVLSIDMFNFIDDIEKHPELCEYETHPEMLSFVAIQMATEACGEPNVPDVLEFKAKRTAKEMEDAQLRVRGLLKSEGKRPSASQFLHFYTQKVGITKDSKHFLVAKALLDIMLTESQFIGEKPSTKAAVALYLTKRVLDGSSDSKEVSDSGSCWWPSSLQAMTEYSAAVLEPVARMLFDMLESFVDDFKGEAPQRYTAIWKQYRNDRLSFVAENIEKTKSDCSQSKSATSVTEQCSQEKKPHIEETATRQETERDAVAESMAHGDVNLEAKKPPLPGATKTGASETDTEEDQDQRLGNIKVEYAMTEEEKKELFKKKLTELHCNLVNGQPPMNPTAAAVEALRQIKGWVQELGKKGNVSTYRTVAEENGQEADVTSEDSEVHEQTQEQDQYTSSAGAKRVRFSGIDVIWK